MTRGRLLDWRTVEDKRETLVVQQFQCADDWPRTARGRKLPKHPREWEFEAQSHVRNLNMLMRDGDRVLLGYDTTVDPEVIAAVLHLRFEVRGTRVVTESKVGAVAMSHRSPSPPYYGDEIMAVALEEARAAVGRYGCTDGMLAGHIHVENNASMRMAQRNDWEPLAGSDHGGYVPWGRTLA